MADSKHIVPFIKQAEGGLSKNPADTASKHPVPDGSGYHTNKGITWEVWSGTFGTDADSIKRFYAMNDDDWNVIFKKFYWNQMLGDSIVSQRIADVIVDWVWGSGKHYPEADVQDILIHTFNEHITEDGNFGPATIKAINEVDEQKLWDAIVAKRFWFLDQIVSLHPTNKQFLQGWKNRMNHLIDFEKK
jgi:lysozyme family protein